MDDTPRVTDDPAPGAAARVDARSQRARAQGRISMRPETARLITANELKKGDVLGAARFAGVQAAKAAHAYLPIAESTLVAGVTVALDVGDNFVDVRASVESSHGPASTPAICAATVALLTVYDMCKSVDRTMVIGPVLLVN